MIELWEILTGIINDKRAKIIRYFVFAVLLSGVIFSGINLFLAVNASKNNFHASDLRETSSISGELDEILTEAQELEDYRRNGNALASSLWDMRKRLFNDDFSGLMNENANEDFSEPQIFVKAVMISGKVSRAIINNGLIVRVGSKLPNDAGQVVRINKNGVTVKVQGREIIYPIK